MFKQFAAAAILATLAASSFAGTPGVYGGLDLGSTKVDDMGRKSSFGGFVGYNFSRNFALEAGYRRLGSWDVVGTDVKVDQVAASFLGSVPLTEQFSIYGRLGYNNLKATGNSTADTSGALYGVGASFDLGNNVGVRMEVQKPSSDSTNVSAHLTFSF